MRISTISLLSILCLIVGCGADGSSSTLVETTETAPATTTPFTIAPSTSVADSTAPSTTGPTSSSTTAPQDAGSFAGPVIGTPQMVEDASFCSIIPTGDDSLSGTGFGKAAGPATPISSTVPGEPACILSGSNVGEISFAISPLEDLQGDISPDGSWSLIDGNTSYLYCSEEEAGEPGCALLTVIDDENALTVFVFLPTNDLANLGETTLQVGELAMENLPDQ
ncbi:MAG: hypothetical protein GEU79_07035 [Acidimicrobiia bacterium]|nr:hypothetical protein [Acidimicrobiia bacterium]